MKGHDGGFMVKIFGAGQYILESAGRYCGENYNFKVGHSNDFWDKIYYNDISGQ